MCAHTAHSHWFAQQAPAKRRHRPTFMRLKESLSAVPTNDAACARAPFAHTHSVLSHSKGCKTTASRAARAVTRHR